MIVSEIAWGRRRMSEGSGDAAGARVVVTGEHPLAIALARGLDARGASVVVVAPGTNAEWPTGSTVACDFRSEDAVAAAIDDAEQRLGGIDQVLHAWVAPGLLDESSFMDVAPDQWIADCEGSLEGAWWLARHLSAPLRRAGGGSVVFVVPSVALAGAAGFSMLATVAEGLRVLAKGCGRQWAQHGITVNTIATAPHHWVSPSVGETLTRAISLSKPAFGTAGDVEDDLAPLVAALADPSSHFLTAGTLVADGGLWMGL
jgi:NAD(P)-dependent dehydrogenase (short-subunit alcohol dehydrogenase family)